MAAENEELQGDTSSNAAESARYPSLKKSISVMSSIYLGSIIFGFAIGIRSKKDFESSEFPHGMYEPPGRVALRALGWGTLLSVCGTTAVVAAMAYALGIRNMSDVDPRTREFVHPKSEAIRRMISRLNIKTVSQRTEELYGTKEHNNTAENIAKK
jgi:hypothetical protein